MSNSLYTLDVNNLFSIRPMGSDTYDGKKAFQRLLDRAKVLKWNQAKIVKQLNISKQLFNNWKARGLPSKELQSVSTVLGCGIDYLLGDDSPAADEFLDPWPFPIRREQWENDVSDTGKDLVRQMMVQLVPAKAKEVSRKKSVD